jgi:hypothetical protein
MRDNPATAPIGARPVDDGDAQTVIAFCEHFRSVLVALEPAFDRPEQAINMAMVAAATFAGIQAGSLLALGTVPDTAAQRDIFSAAMAKNFITGVQMGMQHVADCTDPVIIPFGGTAH